MMREALILRNPSGFPRNAKAARALHKAQQHPCQGRQLDFLQLSLLQWVELSTLRGCDAAFRVRSL